MDLKCWQLQVPIVSLSDCQCILCSRCLDTFLYLQYTTSSLPSKPSGGSFFPWMFFSHTSPSLSSALKLSVPSTITRVITVPAPIKLREKWNELMHVTAGRVQYLVCGEHRTNVGHYFYYWFSQQDRFPWTNMLEWLFGALGKSVGRCLGTRS